MKNNEKSLVVITNKQELQESLKKTLHIVSEKLKELGGTVTATSYKTNGNFKYNEMDGNAINILNSADAVYLLKALALVKRVKKEYEEAAESIGLSSYPVCIWFGAPIDNWIHDLSIRVKVVGNQTLINELTNEKRKLEQFLSEDDRLASTLESVSKLLKKK